MNLDYKSYAEKQKSLEAFVTEVKHQFAKAIASYERTAKAYDLTVNIKHMGFEFKVESKYREDDLKVSANLNDHTI